MHYWLLAVTPLAVCIHEWAHAVIADASGDPGPRAHGRVSLNPIRHLDPVGTVALPIATFMASGGTILLAIARPVWIRPERFRKPRIGLALVALAGPFANLCVGLVSGLSYRLIQQPAVIKEGVLWLAIVSLSMFVLNLLPLPPLDGSRVLAAVLPARTARTYLDCGAWALPAVIAVSVGWTMLTKADIFGRLLGATVLPILRWICGLTGAS